MAAVKKKLGRCDCPICKKAGVVMLKLNDAGTVTWACDDCDSVGFAKAGTDGAAILQGRAKGGIQEPAPAPAPATAPAAPAPAVKRVSSPAVTAPAAPAPTPAKVRKPATPFSFLGA